MKITKAICDALDAIASGNDAGATALAHLLAVALRRDDKSRADVLLEQLKERGYDLAPVMKSGK